MTTFYLVRHGTNDFIGKAIAGRTPGVHLNATGREQAQRVADKTGFLYVDTSDGGRTGYLVEFGESRQVFEDPKEKHTKDYIRGEFS